ncbi:MAG: hypothetical protein ACP5ME_14890, partial [Anaerolineae bacterium]
TRLRLVRLIRTRQSLVYNLQSRQSAGRRAGWNKNFVFVAAAKPPPQKTIFLSGSPHFCNVTDGMV